MQDKLYVGVDGGGTHCRMRLADADLNTLGDAEIDAKSNLQVDEGDAAYSAVMTLIDKVYADAGLDAADAARSFACFGMAGGRLETDRAEFAQRDFPFAGLKVFDDIDIARAGALGGEDGAAIIIGTGSAALGVINGERHQCGGWGFHVGDTMSGAILGRELVRQSLLARDGLRPASPLTEAVMARFDDDPLKLMDWSFFAHGGDEPARPADYGQFAPLVLEYLERSDPVAEELLEFELAAIDQYIDWFRARGVAPVAPVGGLGRGLHQRLVARYGDIIVEPRFKPIHGALILARQLFADA